VSKRRDAQGTQVSGVQSDGQGGTTAPQQESRLRVVARASVVGITLAIALLGAITGTLSWLDQREVAIRLSAGPWPAAEGSPVDATIVNKSRRTVTLTEGQLLLDGHIVGTVRALIPDGAVPARLLPRAEQLRRARFLPVSLEPDEIFAGIVAWRTRGPEKVASRLDVAGDRSLNGRRVAVPLHVMLRLDFDPGGHRTLKLRAVRPRLFNEPTLGSPQFLWLVRHRQVIAFIVRTAVGDAAALATLRVWRIGGVRPVRTITRPFGGEVDSGFPLRSLPRGKYIWALTYGSKTAAGDLETPCHPSERFRGLANVPASECGLSLLDFLNAP
jgi:hypothetical protein